MQLFSPLSDDLFEPSSEFEREVLAFCLAWKSGQTSFLFHTSGSTGAPKPIWLDRKAMEASARTTGEWLQLKQQDVALACLPVNYIAGAMVIVRALVLDLRVCLVEPSANPLLDLAPISIQLASFVPNQWHAILASGVELSAYFVHSKGILLGGAALSDALIARTQELPFPIFETYGMTETVSHIAFRPLGESSFQPFRSVNLRVDERGCLKISGLITGNEWVQTNDIITLNPDATFDLKGRFDRVINSAGRKVHPEELEKFIDAQSDKPEAFFIEALDDEVFGQQVCLFFIGDWSTQMQSSIGSLLRNQFQSWQLPKQYIHLDEFQFTSSGKIDRLKSVALYLKSI